jgi:hypothetical protein
LQDIRATFADGHQNIDKNISASLISYLPSIHPYAADGA